jgi:hypothetical protein
MTDKAQTYELTDLNALTAVICFTRTSQATLIAEPTPVKQLGFFGRIQLHKIGSLWNAFITFSVDKIKISWRADSAMPFLLTNTAFRCVISDVIDTHGFTERHL